MDRYCKLIDGVIEFAPQNKGSIINYDLDIPQMIADGYKLFKPAEPPSETEIRMYHYDYDEYTGYIQEVIIYDETTEEAEERIARVEAERIAQLHLTRGDVFRGLLQAKGITRTQIRAMIEQMPDTTPAEQLAKEMALIDFDEALEFYRGVPLINTLGIALGITSQQMDRFFETNDWHELNAN